MYHQKNAPSLPGPRRRTCCTAPQTALPSLEVTPCATPPAPARPLVSSKLAAAECAVWVSLYDGTGGATSWTHCGANRLDPCACSYVDTTFKQTRGVTCGADGQYILKLDMAASNLTGSLSDTLGDLKQLTYLNLSRNRIEGSIPQALGGLHQLAFLSLGENQIEGTIPQTLGNLQQVAVLNLGHNRLTGVVPSLPFKNYTGWCSLQYPTSPSNHYMCPLPAGAALCKQGPPTNCRPAPTPKDNRMSTTDIQIVIWRALLEHAGAGGGGGGGGSGAPEAGPGCPGAGGGSSSTGRNDAQRRSDEDMKDIAAQSFDKTAMLVAHASHIFTGAAIAKIKQEGAATEDQISKMRRFVTPHEIAAHVATGSSVPGVYDHHEKVRRAPLQPPPVLTPQQPVLQSATEGFGMEDDHREILLPFSSAIVRQPGGAEHQAKR